MKTLAIAVLTIFFVSVSSAQMERLDQFEKSTLAKVQLGMSAAQVKLVLGSPSAIRSGFPDARESIITKMPEQKGQLNSSTWFYAYSPMSIKVNSYMLNAKQVSKQIFDAYLSQDTVFSQDGDIVFPAEAESYRFLKDPKFEARKKSTDEQFTGISKVIKTYKPLLCVIFDRGTQVVSLAKVYFIAPSL